MTNTWSSHASIPGTPSHEWNTNYKPKTDGKEDDVYILTLSTSPALSKPLDELRKEYFPAHLNRLNAHLTLFHALPRSRMPAVVDDLERLSSQTPSFRMATGRPFPLRRGVAIPVSEGATEIKALHSELRGAWHDFLSEQDRAKSIRPHWTVQNKVESQEVRDETMSNIHRTFSRASGAAVGFTLWRYDRGGWLFKQTFNFTRYHGGIPSAGEA